MNIIQTMILNILFFCTLFAQLTVTDPLEITLPRDPVYTGDQLTSSFTIRNNCDETVTIKYLLVAGRKVSDESVFYDFPAVSNLTLQAGESFQYTKQKVLSEPGNYRFYITCQKNDQWMTFGFENQYNVKVLAGVPQSLRIIESLHFRQLQPYFVGDTVYAEFKIQNNNLHQVELECLTIAGRLSGNDLFYDCECPLQNLLLQAGDIYHFRSPLFFRRSGDYTFYVTFQYKETWYKPEPKISLNITVGESFGPPSCSVPQDIPFQKGRILYAQPPYNFQCATGWIDIFHDYPSGGMSKVEIDYLKIWQCIEDDWQLLAEDSYCESCQVGGGVFLRDPWFGDNEHFDFLSFLSSDILVLYPGFYHDKLLHIWNSQWPRRVIDPTANRFKAETRLRITGPAQVRLGMDFWRSPTAEYKKNFENNHEAGSTDWYCQKDNSWQILTLLIDGGLYITSPLHIEPRTNVLKGEELSAKYTLTNRFDNPIHIDSLLTATRIWLDDTWMVRGGFGSVTHIDLEPGQSYNYSQKYIPDTDGRFAFFPSCYFNGAWMLPINSDTAFVRVESPTIVNRDKNSVVHSALHCYPNPFNSQIRLVFFLQRPHSLYLRIINLNGQVEKEYYFSRHPQGTGSVLWDGRDRFGRPVASGIYWIQLQTSSFFKTAKVLLLR